MRALAYCGAVRKIRPAFARGSLVILQGQNEPGGGFWGCAPNVPHRPRNDIQRITEWNRIVQDVIAYNWPLTLP